MYKAWDQRVSSSRCGPPHPCSPAAKQKERLQKIMRMLEGPDDMINLMFSSFISKFNPNTVTLFCSVNILAVQFRCIWLVKCVLGLDCEWKSSVGFEQLLGQSLFLPFYRQRVWMGHTMICSFCAPAHGSNASAQGLPRAPSAPVRPRVRGESLPTPLYPSLLLLSKG